MTSELGNSNAVIAARNFNPSIISQIWLVDNGIVGRDDFRPGCVFSDMLVNIRTDAFECLVTPDRFQLTLLADNERQRQDIVVSTLGRIVELLPHTPFHGVGMNFTWHVTPPGEDIGALTRAWFYRQGNPIFESFDTADARFGGYFSKDIMGGRLKLEIKPAIIARPKGQSQIVQFAFNFHHDLLKNDDAVATTKQFLGRWDEAFGIASEILQRAEVCEYDHR